MASLFRHAQWTVLAAALLPFSVAAQTARVGAPAPDLRQPTLMAEANLSTNITASLWSWSGTTRAVPTRKTL